MVNAGRLELSEEGLVQSVLFSAMLSSSSTPCELTNHAAHSSSPHVEAKTHVHAATRHGLGLNA